MKNNLLSQSIRWPGLSFRVDVSPENCLIRSDEPVRCLSSAVLGGGMGHADIFLNHRVTPNPGRDYLSCDGRPVQDERGEWEAPQKTLRRILDGFGHYPSAVGMMTSAGMEGARLSVKEEGWGGVFALVTVGLGNARAAGDPADYFPGSGEKDGASLPTGTINIIAGTNMSLSDAALAEALMVVTEAKTALLLKAGVISPVSGRPATGTGTDALAILTGTQGRVDYAGKHTLIGSLFGAAVTEALGASLEFLQGMADFDWGLIHR